MTSVIEHTAEPGGVPEMTSRRIGNALVVHPKDRLTAEARNLALDVAADPHHELVVVDLPAGSPFSAWESVADLMPRPRRGVRIVIGGRSRETTALAGQWLAERLNRPVVAPDGVIMPGVGGSLFVDAGRGGGWIRFQPGRPPRWESKRFPKPEWESLVPAEVVVTSATGVAEPLGGGVWIRPAGEEATLRAHRARLQGNLPCQPDVLTVVLGCPGARPVTFDDVARFWAGLPKGLRPRVRLLGYGPVADLEGASSAQALADFIGDELIWFAGLPLGAVHDPDIYTVRAGGAPGWRSSVRELGYTPQPPGTTRPPRLVSHRAPVAGISEVAPAVYWYAPDAVVEVVPAGLWVRPADEPAHAEAVRTTPVDAERHLMLFEATTDALAARMRQLAEDLVARLDPTTRYLSELVPARGAVPVRAVGRAMGELESAADEPTTAPEPAAEPATAVVAVPPAVAPVTAPESFGTAALTGPVHAPAPEETTPHRRPDAGEQRDSSISRRLDVEGGTPPPPPAVPPAAPPLPPASPPAPPADSPSAAAPPPVAPPSDVPPAAAPLPIAPPAVVTSPDVPPSVARPPATLAPAAPPQAVAVPVAGPSLVPHPVAPPSGVSAEPQADAPPTPRPGAGRPPAVDRPAAGPPATGHPTVDHPTVDHPTVDSPTAERPAPTDPAPADRSHAEATDQGREATGPTGAQPEPGPSAQVRAQPVPAPAAAAVVPKRGLDEERAWLRSTLNRQFTAVANSVARVLSEHPSFQGSPGGSGDLLTDAVAVRLYLSADGDGVDAALRTAGVGPHVPFARCAVSGLNRPPSHRGIAVFTTSVDDRAWELYRRSRFVTDWGFVNALTGPCAAQDGDVDVLLWSMTGRRSRLLEPEVGGIPDRVVFVPGTSFKVLGLAEPADGARGRVLLRELAVGEVDARGRVDRNRVSLDELAVNALRATADKWATDREQARTPAGAASRFRALPGLV